MKKWISVRKDLHIHLLEKEKKVILITITIVTGSTIDSGIKGISTTNSGWNNAAKEVKCWGCNGPHLYRNFPHNPNKKMAPINMVNEASTVIDMARNIPRINVALEDRQADHQSTMLEVEGKISSTSISIVIDSSAS